MTRHVNSDIAKPQVLNAFQTLVPRSTRPDSARTPKKRGPKGTPNQRAAISMETPEERAAKRTARILRDNSKQFYSVGATSQADIDKTQMLMGRSFVGSRA